ncbi:leucine-rich repeat protein, partial [Mycoplasma sp. MV126]|uniref:leucine-rich repeat protein n=1 Tax=Mycoplasma sp. MV126 TaxID=3401676 RepID=UPI003AAC304C
GKEQPGKEQPGKEQPGKEDNNTYSFLYNDGGKKINVKYYGNENENRILIPDAQEITALMLEYIFDNIEKNLDIKLEDNIILECPNALTICLNYHHPYMIKKLILPKIENVINNIIDGPYSSLNDELDGDKVIQNGILFKWNNTTGNIEDKSIRKIIAYAFGNTDSITSLNFPNVEYIDPNAFISKRINTITKPFPLIKMNKLVINSVLLKWSDASGDIIDDSITSIAAGVFDNNQNITSASFLNVTSIGDYAFEG